MKTVHIIQHDGRYGGEYLSDRVPRGTTEIPPPKYDEANQIPVFKQGEWEIQSLSFFDDHDPEAEWNQDKWVIPVEVKKDRKKAEIAESRWMEETSGLILPNGMEIATDDRSQMKMLSIYAKAQADANYSVRFKTPKGWITLDSATILSLQAYVFEHIENLFKKEEQKCIEVDACKTIEEVEAISWDEDISGIDSKE